MPVDRKRRRIEKEQGKIERRMARSKNETSNLLKNLKQNIEWISICYEKKNKGDVKTSIGFMYI